MVMVSIFTLTTIVVTFFVVVWYRYEYCMYDCFILVLGYTFYRVQIYTDTLAVSMQSVEWKFLWCIKNDVFCVTSGILVFQCFNTVREYVGCYEFDWDFATIIRYNRKQFELNQFWVCCLFLKRNSVIFCQRVRQKKLSFSMNLLLGGLCQAGVG